jgi:hypothetical protein
VTFHLAELTSDPSNSYSNISVYQTLVEVSQMWRIGSALRCDVEVVPRVSYCRARLGLTSLHLSPRSLPASALPTTADCAR